MSYKVIKLSPKEWYGLSENAHKAVFNEVKPASMDRIDFALLCQDPATEKLLAYVTCREFDHETLYWQYGGSLPGTKNSIRSWGCYKAFTGWCSEHYKRITTMIENDNTVMLKFASKIGYKIIGVRNFKDNILLEHILEFEG